MSSPDDTAQVRRDLDELIARVTRDDGRIDHLISRADGVEDRVSSHRELIAVLQTEGASNIKLRDLAQQLVDRVSAGESPERALARFL